MQLQRRPHGLLKRSRSQSASIARNTRACSDLIASAPAEHEALSSLVRALVRFQYDEWTYNGHRGGEQGPESILCDENPIVEHAAVPGFPRDAGEYEGFLMGAFSILHIPSTTSASRSMSATKIKSVACRHSTPSAHPHPRSTKE